MLLDDGCKVFSTTTSSGDHVFSPEFEPPFTVSRVSVDFSPSSFPLDFYLFFVRVREVDDNFFWVVVDYPTGDLTETRSSSFSWMSFWNMVFMIPVVCYVNSDYWYGHGTTTEIVGAATHIEVGVTGTSVSDTVMVQVLSLQESHCSYLGAQYRQDGP